MWLERSSAKKVYVIILATQSGLASIGFKEGFDASCRPSAVDGGETFRSFSASDPIRFKEICRRSRKLESLRPSVGRSAERGGGRKRGERISNGRGREGGHFGVRSEREGRGRSRGRIGRNFGLITGGSHDGGSCLMKAS